MIARDRRPLSAEVSSVASPYAWSDSTRTGRPSCGDGAVILRTRSPTSEGGKVGDRGVNVHLPVLDELHDRQDCKGLGREARMNGSEGWRYARKHQPETLKVLSRCYARGREPSLDVSLSCLLGQVGVDRDASGLAAHGESAYDRAAGT